MAPALLPVDWLLARRVSGMPDRGDVAIFKHPNQKTDYVKRVTGMSGDQISLSTGVVQLNGEPLNMAQEDPWREKRGRHTGQKSLPCTNEPVAIGEICEIERWQEILPGGPTYSVLNLGNTAVDDFEDVTVPPQHLVMLGDNRDNSVDSRFPSVGMVPVANLRHKTWMVHTSLDQPSQRPRWSRFFNWVH